ncbi:HEAT repeat domain-containing protein [Microcoleus sp. B7-D4]|uniref:HEAT repeat domain-containing protein n=1 Tax=Microcoleus sp. B7-D4 TaxID=2818696 RepID=UPI002FD11D91
MGKPTGLGKLAQATMNFIQKVAMARKYGKNATTKNNVFKLVEALLALTNGEIGVAGDKLKVTFQDNGEIAVSGDKLKATLKLLWEKENELLVSGKFQQKLNNNKTKIVEGITKEDLCTLVECLGKALELSQPNDEKNVNNSQRRGEAIQDVLDCLKDLGILYLKPSARNQGYWKFSLKLKNQINPKENLEVIEEKWKVKFGSVTVEISHETPKPKEEPINWQEICRQNLAHQQQLTTNPFTNACGMTPQLDGVYVPLAIVERQKPKPQPRNQQEEKEKETEKLIPIAEERFFEDVLRQGKSDISQGRKIAIIGEPGAGKTTRLQKIADWILEQELGLPIWIDLAELGAQSICDHLEKVWLSRCPGGVTRGDLEAQMSRVWLLLDGVDEMANTQGMQQLAKDLSRTWVQAARVVVTCRVNVWEADKNAFSGFDVFRNLEFNSEQVTEYIRRWFAGMGDAATGESLEAELAESENSRLKELIQNPLRLWMLCQIWSSRQGTLPDTQAKLYASFIKYFYRWKEQIIKIYEKLCGKSHNECQKLLHEGLGELAKAAIDGKSSRFRLSYRLVSQYLGDRSDETSLLSLALSLGWLNRVGIDFDEPEESVYAFYHATFQEYFAALAVDDWDYFLPRNHVDFPVVGKAYRIFEAQWKQVILLWFGLEGVGKNEKEAFIKALVEFEDGRDIGFYKIRAYFLAAAGIAEFKDCSLADEIVSQIVKWGFAEKQDSLQVFSPIFEVAREILKDTDRERAIAALVELIGTLQNEDTRWQAVYSLAAIDKNNAVVISALVQLIGTSQNEDPRRKVEYLLEKIGKDNPVAIAALVQLIRTSQNEDICRQAAYSLGKIGKNNPVAIADLVQLIHNSGDESTRYQAADSLGKIDKDNPVAIAALVELINSAQNQHIRCFAARSLGEIDKYHPVALAAFVDLINSAQTRNTWRAAIFNLGRVGKDNPVATAALVDLINSAISKYTLTDAVYSLAERGENKSLAIAALVKLINTSQDEYIRSAAAGILGELDKDNPVAVSALVEFISNSGDEYTRVEAAYSLGAIDKDNPVAIAALVELIRNSDNERTRSLAADSLGKISKDNPVAISALVELINTSQDESTRRQAANSLGKISKDNPVAISALVELINTSQDESTRRQAANSLGKISKDNPVAISALVELINTSQYESTRSQAADSLGKIMKGKHFATVVSGLKNYLTSQVRANAFDLLIPPFRVIWNCAQNLPYPTFYQAWHHQLTTPHPEVPETTGVGSTPFTQSLNLADLPNILDARLADTQLIESVQLICIDTSKFIDSDNPALDIYEQFLDQNCPERLNGEPETLPQLKSYWNRLRRHSNKHPILIFYEDPTSAAARGFSPTFLDALTRFHGTICLITDSPHPPLQTFSPHDPDLLQTVVNWLKRLHLES